MRELLLISCLGLLCACPRPTGTTGTGGQKVDVKKDATADEALAKAISVADSKSRKEGIQALLLVRKTYPETTAGQEALYRVGVLAFEEGDYALARKSLGELLFENPLHPKANDARLKSGLAAVEQKAYRDAFQTLSTLVERLEGEDKKLAEAALVRAAAGSQQYGEALKSALKGVDAASGPEETKQALANLEDVVETKTTFLAIAEAWNDLPKSHPGWPLITFKMARVFYHLRDWTRLDETLKSLISTAPDSPYTPDAKALVERLSKRSLVKPKAVGAVLPMTGKYKAFGETTMRGLQLALKGSDIELIVKDTQGDPSLTARLVEQLAFDDGVIAIIGPLLAEDAKRGALVAEELQVPLITLSRADGLTEIGPHIFRTMVTNSQQAEALADYAMTTLGYKTFAILHPNTPFGVELSNEFWDAIEKRGGQIRGIESYDHDQKTFTEEAKRLAGRYYLEDRADYHEKIREIREATTDEFRRRKAVEKMKASLEPVIDFEAMLIPDSWQQVSLVAPALAVEDIITNACDKKDLERIQKTTGKDKLKTVTLLGPSTWSSPKGTSGDLQLMERGGKYVLCSVYVEAFYETSDRPSTRAFVAAFREAHKDASITLLDAVGFDSGAMVRSIIEKQAPTTRANFREVLQHLKDFQGATGSLTIDDSREARRQLYLLNITTKGVKEVTPKRPEG
ncbi:MAG: penicillin-binding protein activator [Archangium sp.]|nr:penicillin-binding protein activator [Archangium sp.]